ncbi:MAG: mechanosensitive ion channel [Planctomycetaceae bacterium]|nr:mechanosensitive ion channel [Planctomycetaceae bacterium]
MTLLRRYGITISCAVLGLILCSPLRAQLPQLPVFQQPVFEQPAPEPTAAATPAVEAAPPQSGVQFVGLDTVKSELGQSWQDIWSGITKILGTPLIAGAKDTDPPALTIGQLCIGLVLLIFGYFAAGMISRWTANKLLTRFGLNKSAIAPIQSITFYLLLGTFTMFSLNVLNVPMTVFSFLGGALAIGAGFGSQNIVNNFISGLILLAERPIRVGDTIQLDGWTGTVSQIGARSTKITNGSNHEIIVPNSKLLETSVVNWTLTDDTVGCTISVGAAYGSPTREVQRLLLLAAKEHPQVLAEPPPAVIFKDFAADALLFELRFWVNLRATNKGEVESDLRFRIDELMADRGIVLAFPQRDVHLNVLRPIEVRLRDNLGQVRSAAA